MSGPAGSAREAALEALGRQERGSGFLRDALHEVFQESTLAPRDRALATQLATGVVRHRRTLRLVISHVRGRGSRASAIQPELLAILEMGVFQLLFLERVPDYAAVNEAAEAARRTARGKVAARKIAGFVNGVLRGVTRLIVGRDAAGVPGPQAIPHPEGGVVRLRTATLPDPEANRAAFLGAAYSYPDWLAARWLRHFGEETEEICRWGNRRPHIFARANSMRAGAEALLERLRAEAPGVAAGPRPGSLDVSDLPAERLEALAREGWMTVQDPSAMVAVEVLAPQPGEDVLDLCASPGTKTTQIVEAMGDQGRVVACDRSDDKLELVRRTIAERGIRSAAACLPEEVARAGLEGGFDAALVDVPCSNTGVLARRVEARWRLRPEDLEELGRLQRTLLEQAAAMVRPGGRVVYSTCSLEPEENDAVVQAFVREHAGWELRRRQQLLPGPDHDGAFVALLARPAEKGS